MESIDEKLKRLRNEEKYHAISLYTESLRTIQSATDTIPYILDANKKRQIRAIVDFAKSNANDIVQRYPELGTQQIKNNYEKFLKIAHLEISLN